MSNVPWDVAVCVHFGLFFVLLLGGAIIFDEITERIEKWRK